MNARDCRTCARCVPLTNGDIMCPCEPPDENGRVVLRILHADAREDELRAQYVDAIVTAKHGPDVAERVARTFDALCFAAVWALWFSEKESWAFITGIATIIVAAVYINIHLLRAARGEEGD